MTMSIRIFGAILIITGCSFLGAMISRREKLVLLQLEEFACVLEKLICELEYRRTPLPELFRSMDNNTGFLGGIFRRIADEMDTQIKPRVSDCVQAVLCECNDLPNTTQMYLLRMGESMGRFDVEGEIMCIGSLQDELMEKLTTMRHTLKDKTKTNQTLWVCAGVTAAVLMM